MITPVWVPASHKRILEINPGLDLTLKKTQTHTLKDFYFHFTTLTHSLLSRFPPDPNIKLAVYYYCIEEWERGGRDFFLVAVSYDDFMVVMHIRILVRSRSTTLIVFCAIL